jgi:hypothetical protein
MTQPGKNVAVNSNRTIRKMLKEQWPLYVYVYCQSASGSACTCEYLCSVAVWQCENPVPYHYRYSMTKWWQLRDRGFVEKPYSFGIGFVSCLIKSYFVDWYYNIFSTHDTFNVVVGELM